MFRARQHMKARPRRIEPKLELLLEHLGLDGEAQQDLPAGALRGGSKIEAAKLFRKATGTGLADAKRAVEEAAH